MKPELDMAMHRIREWQIKCPVCGHTGDVLMSLRRLRLARFRCSTCGKAEIEVIEAIEARAA